jgi:multiple sugar transport system permease protein
MILSPTTTRNFEKLFAGPFPGSLVSSVIITTAVTVGTLVFGVPAGYAFARGRFLGRRLLGGWLLFSRMMPPVIFIIPLFLFFHQLHLINSYLGLTLAYMTGLLPFTVWMAASYFQDIPLEIEEAARVDGASRLQSFVRVSLPLAIPGIITIGLLIAIASWSEYFIPPCSVAWGRSRPPWAS